MVRLLLFCIALALPTAAMAQTVAIAQISGVVTDDSGGALPGVEVTVTQTSTGLVRFVVTGSGGEYVLPNLPIGPYKLEAKLQGFSTFEQTGIVLQVGASPVVNVSLKIGGLAETITVAAGATMVETRNTSVGTVVSQEQMVGLPLDGRQASQLVFLSGLAVAQPGGLIGSQREYPSAVAISVAGGTGNSTIYLVDGAFNNDPVNNIGQPMPFPDALEEFKVETGARPARYGIYTGATVNAVTKAGTNSLHGNLFEFMRNHKFNARNAFALTDDGLSRHQMGGTVGGPIKQNRLFFFGGLQYSRNRQRPSDAQAFVPTAAMLQGDFTQVASAACNNGTALTLPLPFVGNRVSPTAFNPISMRIVGLLPTASDPCGRTIYGVADNNDEQQIVGRLDWQATQSQRFFGRYYVANYDRAPGFDGQNLLLASGSGLGLDNRVQTLSVGDDYLLSQNLVSATRFAYARSRINRTQGEDLPNYSALGSNVFSAATDPGLSFFNLAVTNGFPTAAFPGNFESTTYQLSQDFDWIKGAHQLSFGGSWIRPGLDVVGPFQANGIFTFNGTRVGAGRLGLADLMLGQPSQFRQGGNQTVNQRLNYLGAYVQDVWRVGDKLTLNAGLRWEPYFSATDDNGFYSHFSLDAFQAGRRSSVFTNAPAGLPVRRRRRLPRQRQHLRQPQSVRAAPRAGLGPGRRQRPDHPRRRRRLLRLAQAVAVRPPSAECALRQHHPGESTGVDQRPLGRLSGRQPVPDSVPAARRRALSDARHLRDDAARSRPDAGHAVERQLPAAVRLELDGFGVLSRQPHVEHLDRQGAESRGGHPRVHPGQPGRAPRAGAAEPGRGRVLLDHPGVVPGLGPLSRRDLRLAKADERRLEHEHQPDLQPMPEQR
jgi:hypothetical protein